MHSVSLAGVSKGNDNGFLQWNLPTEFTGASKNSDSIFGGAGNDTIHGGAGRDTIDGGTGNDSLTGGEGADTFVYTAGGGADTITEFGVHPAGSVDDGDQTNNDFVDLSAFYNATTLAAVTAAGGGFANALAMLKADAARGTIDGIIDGTDYSSHIKDIKLTLQNGLGDPVDGSLLTHDTTNVVCFAQGTLIKTIDGERPVEELSQGDLVWTKDAGYQPIRWIGHKSFDKAMLEAHENLRPIRIKAGSLGLGMPERDLVVSQHHRILVSSRIVQRMLNETEILVGAKFLLPLEGIDVACDMDEVTYVHFLFDRHQIVLSNGAETESLFTGPEALKSVPQEARDEIFAIFPELMTMNPKDTPSVRRMTPGRIGKQLAMRHHLNQKRLVEKIEKRIEALIASTNLLAPQADTSDETVLS